MEFGGSCELDDVRFPLLRTSDITAGPSVSACLDSFLSKCLDEQLDEDCGPWGESTGQSSTDPQILVNPSSDEANTAHTGDLALLVVMPTNVGVSGIPTAGLEIVPILDAPAILGRPMTGLVIGETWHSEESTGGSCKKAGCFKLVQRRSRRKVLEHDQVEKCPICMDSLMAGHQVQKLPCSHVLHRRCCMKYFRTSGVKPLCPVCRFDMAST
jgi:hypothetical protein